MGWLDWLNVAGSVIDIVSEVAGLLGSEEDSGSASAYTLGTVDWVPYNGAIYAVNNDPSTEVGLLYVIPNLTGTTQSTLSTGIWLHPNGGFSDETANLTQFLGGTVSMNALPPADANTPGQVFSFVMRTFSAAAAVSIIGGVQANFNRTGTGWSFTLRTTGPKIDSFRARVSDPAGNSGEVEAKFKPPGAQVGSDSVTLDLPPGIDLSAFVASMTVDLTMAAGEVRKMLGGARQGRAASEMPDGLRGRLQRA
jgi:hypothetical protein